MTAPGRPTARPGERAAPANGSSLLLGSAAVETDAASSTGTAFARVGLLGNPSDGYGGRVLAFTMRELRARVRVTVASSTRIDDALAAPLVRASAARYARATGVEPSPLDVDVDTDIPFQVGLSGSSAIVIATLRALGALHGAPLAHDVLAETALAVEVDDLGIAAGPMDRRIQAFGGLRAMDFAPDAAPASDRVLDPAQLPALLVAWDPTGGAPSGHVHSNVRDRWHSGETELRDAMQRFASLCDRGVAALEAGDDEAFRAAVDANFELRCACLPVADRDRQLVAIAREHGAAGKQTGSGGACVAVPSPATDTDALVAAYRRAGFDVLRPTVGDPQ